MDATLLAVIWVALGAGVTLLTGKGIARGQRPRIVDDLPAVHSVAQPVARPAEVRRYVSLDLAEIARAAHAAATEDLLATRPGSIRQVPAR